MTDTVDSETVDDPDSIETEVSSKELVETVKAATEINPIKAVLGPISALAGKDLADWYASRKARNAKAHSEAFFKDKTPEDINDKNQLRFLRWCQEAGEVDPDEIERASAVRAALEKTLQGEESDARILMELSKEEITSMVAAGHKQPITDEYAAASLLQKNLARHINLFLDRGDHRVSPIKFLEMLALTTITGLTAILLVSPNIIDTALLAADKLFEPRLVRPHSDYDGIFTYSMIAAVLIVFGHRLYLILSRKYYLLSPKGEHIARLLKRYLEEGLSPR